MKAKFKCDNCKRDIEQSKDRLKVIRMEHYKEMRPNRYNEGKEYLHVGWKTIHEGDLCSDCWQGIKK